MRSLRIPIATSKHNNKPIVITVDAAAGRFIFVRPIDKNLKVTTDTGINLNTYITELKIDEAAIMLKTTELTAVEIAETLAFSSQSYFQSNFKKVMKVTPREYRKNNVFLK